MADLCPNCGAPVAEGSTRCRVCGARLLVDERRTAVARQAAYPFGQVPSALAAAPADAAHHAIRTRNFWKFLLLSLISFGLGGLYWFYTFTDEVHALSQQKSTPHFPVVLLLTFLTFGLYSFYYVYRMTEALDHAMDQRHMNGLRFPPLLAVILCALPILLISIPLLKLCGFLFVQYILIHMFNRIVKEDEWLDGISL